MRNSIIILAVSSFLAVGTAEASASKEENIGVGTGLAIGAAAGGPVGALVGAAAGALLGDSINKRKTKMKDLSTSLDESRSTVSELQSDIAALDREVNVVSKELDRAQSVAKPELLALLQAGIEMDLLFRTDEHVLADTTGDRLNALATTIASMPDVHIQLDGFADERGDATYNQQLSGKRADYVREVLIGGGVDASRINVVAHGESPASDENVDSYALERRVSLTLYIDEAPSFASNPVD